MIPISTASAALMVGVVMTSTEWAWVSCFWKVVATSCAVCGVKGVSVVVVVVVESREEEVVERVVVGMRRWESVVMKDGLGGFLGVLFGDGEGVVDVGCCDVLLFISPLLVFPPFRRRFVYLTNKTINKIINNPPSTEDNVIMVIQAGDPTVNADDSAVTVGGGVVDPFVEVGASGFDSNETVVQ